MKRIIYSIFIDIKDKDLDNPGWYSPEGVQQKVDKSKLTRDYFLKSGSDK